MVEFHDGSTVAQASPPDMHLPIALGLTWPDRAVGVAAPCAWDQATAWTFEPLDDATFPAVGLARSAATASPSHPAVLNAANEQCVAAFLQGRLTYLGITDVVQEVLAAYSPPPAGPGGALALADVLGAEEWARARAEEPHRPPRLRSSTDVGDLVTHGAPGRPPRGSCRFLSILDALAPMADDAVTVAADSLADALSGLSAEARVARRLRVSRRLVGAP